MPRTRNGCGKLTIPATSCRLGIRSRDAQVAGRRLGGRVGVGIAPVRPQTGKQERLPVRPHEARGQRPLGDRRLPFVEPVGRDLAATFLECRPEGRLLGDGFGTGVDERIRDLLVLGPRGQRRVVAGSVRELRRILAGLSEMRGNPAAAARKVGRQRGREVLGLRQLSQVPVDRAGGELTGGVTPFGPGQARRRGRGACRTLMHMGGRNGCGCGQLGFPRADRSPGIRDRTDFPGGSAFASQKGDRATSSWPDQPIGGEPRRGRESAFPATLGGSVRNSAGSWRPGFRATFLPVPPVSVLPRDIQRRALVAGGGAQIHEPGRFSGLLRTGVLPAPGRMP